MALKTGYKVKGKEIILDNYSAYGDDSVKDSYTSILSNYYKVNNNEIQASYYVQNRGQIAAELPGDNYYKTPSGITVPKFALYGTNTVGGYFDGNESKYWKKFNGYSNEVDARSISVSFDGAHLTAMENGTVTNLRTYELDDHTPLDLDVIKVWCYMVGAGGGGSSYKDITGPKGGGGGGGASAIVCLRLYKGDTIVVSIPGRASADSSGYSITLSYGNPTKTFSSRGGGAGDQMSGGEGGQVDRDYQLDDYIVYYDVRKGGDGGYTEDGKSVYTFTYAADYLQIWDPVENKGGAQSSLSGGGVLAGGGASGFPGGKGGYGSSGGHMDYNAPGPGGGGGSVYEIDGTTYGGTGGPGAFWILCA